MDFELEWQPRAGVKFCGDGGRRAEYDWRRNGVKFK
jgi:hypothetical protein